jgi:predicted transcriptional regulator
VRAEKAAAKSGTTPLKIVTLRLSDSTFRRLRKLAAAIDRSEDSLAVQAVESYLDLNEWQTKAIRDAVRMANRRNAKFVDQDEVDAWLATWGTARESKRPR